MTAIADFKKKLGRIHADDLGIYVHIPFCRTRCRFCAFYMKRHREDRVQRFLQALHQELRVYARDVGLGGLPVHTVYLGGGTPTTLTPRQLIQVLNRVRGWFVLDDAAEVSVEVHPGTITLEDLGELRQAGFTRLSVGGQSFDDTELLELGGRTFGAGAGQAVHWAKSSGFKNISLDLLFGFPGQSTESWKRTLEQALALPLTHLSCYAYTMEEGSFFHQEVLHGKGSKPDQALQVLLETIAVQRLSAAGFERYEISNYCQPGYKCRHNMRYWLAQSYLGLGPSAQSRLGDGRFGNMADLDGYVDSLKEARLPLDEITWLSPEQIDRERIILGLRMLSGVSVQVASGGNREETPLTRTIHQLREQGLVFIEERERLRLTNFGIRFADTVAVTLL